MRSDMAKVLCERQRSKGDGGRSIPPKGTRKRLSKEMNSIDSELCRRRESTARHRVYGWDCKQFGENLGPLRNYILSCIGRKWDDVYSEVTRTIPKGNVVNNHLYTHLYQYVCVNAYKKNGKVYDGDYSNYHARRGMPVWQDTYVDPDTGILCLTPVRAHKYRHKKKVNTDWINKPGKLNEVFYRKDGIWYLCKFADIPADAKSASGYDILYHYKWSWHEKKDYRHFYTYQLANDNKRHVLAYFYRLYNCHKYCYQKQQLGKADLKRFKRLREVS
jgi:hypothetical protein